MHGSDLHTSAHTHKRARTHYVHMTAPNQKTKTITQSIVSHLAFDLRTSIDRFSLQSRECSVYRWRSGVTRWAGAKWQKSWLYERHQTHLMLYKQPIIQVSLKKEEEEEETVGCFLRAVETHADAQNQHTTYEDWNESRLLTWSARLVDDPESSSWSDFELPSRSSITRSIGIFPFKQLMYRWQKLSQSSCT